MKALASHTDNLARVNSLEGRARSNLGSDGRSTRESESSEGSGELRHDSVQTTTIYESLAAELRAKLGEYYSELLPLFLFDVRCGNVGIYSEITFSYKKCNCVLNYNA